MFLCLFICPFHSASTTPYRGRRRPYISKNKKSANANNDARTEVLQGKAFHRQNPAGLLVRARADAPASLVPCTCGANFPHGCCALVTPFAPRPGVCLGFAARLWLYTGGLRWGFGGLHCLGATILSLPCPAYPRGKLHLSQGPIGA